MFKIRVKFSSGRIAFMLDRRGDVALFPLKEIAERLAADQERIFNGCRYRVVPA